MPLIHMLYPGMVLLFSQTNLDQFGLVIWSMFLFGGHDDPASKALLAKCLCTDQGSHTYKRCSSQPYYTSLWSKRRRRQLPPQRQDWQLTVYVRRAWYRPLHLPPPRSSTVFGLRRHRLLVFFTLTPLSRS